MTEQMRTLSSTILLIVAWLTANAIWGLTGPPTLISGWLEGITGLERHLASGSLILLLFILVSLYRRDRAFLHLSLTISAYVAGVLISQLTKQSLQPSNLFLSRSFILLPAIPMLIVAIFVKGNRPYPFRWGDWQAPCNLKFLSKRSWSAALVKGLLYIALPALVLFQAGVAFEPIATGRLWNWIPTILGLSFLNGFAEELLFRGLIMVPLVGLLGIEKGVWMQAAFFGIHHWGASPDAIAGLPMAVILTFLGFLLGRSVIATSGLAWAVVFHAALDVASLAAQLPQ